MSDGTVPVTAQAAPSVSGPLDTSGSGAPPSTTTPPSSHSHDHPPPPTDSSTATTAVAGNETAPGVGSNGNARFTESPPHSQHISRARSRTVSSVSTSDIPLHERHPPPFSKPVTRALFLRPAHTRGPAPGLKDSIISAFTYSKLNLLLVCNPVAWGLHYGHANFYATFVLSLLGVIPLAGWLSHATESLALFCGDAIAAIANASLGNCTELIVAILLLTKCQISVVQASLLGGLLSNLLLVLGMAFAIGGIRFSEQEFRQTAAQLNTSLMVLAVFALIVPAAFAFALEQSVSQDQERNIILDISRGSSIILIAIYLLYMVFQLYSHNYLYVPESPPTTRTHSPAQSIDLNHQAEEAQPMPPPPVLQQAMATGRLAPARANSFAFGSAAALGSGQQQTGRRRSNQQTDPEKGEQQLPPMMSRQNTRPPIESRYPTYAQSEHGSEKSELECPSMSLSVSIGLIVLATGLTYLTAEALTDSLEAVGDQGGVSKEWLGLIVLAIASNSAEHATAVLVAYKNKVDLALSIAVGSCVQISLFVIPVLVLLGWIIDKPLSLLFDPLETVVLFLSVLLVRFATEDGRTHYLSGVCLLGTYILIAFSWYYPSEGIGIRDLFPCTV